MQFQPREIFTIVRHLPDPNDLTTNYVQAIVRNSRTGDILDTLNLVESGTNTHRFTKDYQIPADVSGLGFYIDITTYVYTDAGLTTKSTVYGEDNNTYLVFDRTKHIGGGGDGGGVDYKKIRKILGEFFSTFSNTDSKGVITSIKTDEVEVDLAPIMAELQAIKRVCEDMEMPEQEKVELEPVITAIKQSESSIKKAINDKEVTEATDLVPVLDAISRFEKLMADHTMSQAEKMDTSVKMFEDLHGKFSTTFIKDYPQIAEALDQLVKNMREAFVYTNSKSFIQKPDVGARTKTLIG